MANGVVPWITDEGLRLLLVKLITSEVPQESLENIVSTWRIDEGTNGVHDETLTLGELYLAYVSRDFDAVQRAMSSLRERHPDSANTTALVTYGRFLIS
jgi:hypothetical protein